MRKTMRLGDAYDTDETSDIISPKRSQRLIGLKSIRLQQQFPTLARKGMRALRISRIQIQQFGLLKWGSELVGQCNLHCVA